MPELGSKISLISKSDIRYEGQLYTVDPNECTIALANGKLTSLFFCSHLTQKIYNKTTLFFLRHFCPRHGIFFGFEICSISIPFVSIPPNVRLNFLMKTKRFSKFCAKLSESRVIKVYIFLCLLVIWLQYYVNYAYTHI